MLTALQNTYLSWNLESPVSYQAGQELEFTLHFSAPEALWPRKRKFYIAGALYTKGLAYITGTVFGIFQAPGTDFGAASTQYTSVWELEAGESVDLPCRVTLNRSDVILGLFLFKMEGDAPSLGVDEEIASISAELASPAPAWTWESIMTIVVVVGMLGFVGYTLLED